MRSRRSFNKVQSATGKSVNWFNGRRLHRDSVDILLIEMETA